MVHKLHLLPSPVHLRGPPTMTRSLPLLLLLLLIFTATAKSSNNSIRRPFQEQHTNLHFYWHIKLQEPNRTTVEIIKSPINSPTLFGQTKVFDNPITVEPNITSQLLGWSQGTYVSVDQKKIAVIVAMTFVFVDDKYGGSTFSVLGRNEIELEVRELPVVGGTGVFRLARGYCQFHTFWENNKTHDAIADYNCNIFHIPQVISSI